MTLIKKRFHPLGGFYIEGALKWMIPANPLMLLVGVLMLVHDIYSLWNKWMDEKRENPIDYYVRLSLWLGYVLHLLVGLPMDIFLWRAAKTKNVLKLKVWIIVNFFNTLWATLEYWVHTFYFGIHYPSLTPYNFYCIFRFYMCIVIHYFSLDIENEEEAKAETRMLTESELEEFENGLSRNERMLEIETRNLIDKVQYMRYKREEFEIDMERLEIDTDNPLGSGEYGIVYRALLQKESKTQPVAVKTFESGVMDAVCFKALLKELKVVTCLGHHDHILGLVGAVTSKIKMRNLHMVLEFCPFGSLLEYLKASRALFTNSVLNGEIIYENMHNGIPTLDDGLNTLDLLRWVGEIACGMAYLEHMNVIHGDLAARNLLLSQSKQIKIGDFGLARQLYQYSVYVKRQNTPLPWRWLALESITDMSFSIKSDVWAFGIVLHELFTLGEIPYVETKQFTLDFIDSIRNGMRLEQTPFCPNVVYRYARNCWNENPAQRPSFHDLHKTFKFLLKGNMQEV